MKHRWLIAPWQSSRVEQLADQLRSSTWLAQCLLNRGLEDADQAQRFLEPRLRSLSDPFALPGMRAAVDRLYQARRREERLVIFGDYDVDGVTSMALLTEVLVGLGWSVGHYLPHRMGEGYGLTRDAVETCLERCRPTLLLAVDCGSTAVETIDWLQEMGVDTIVVDHHQVSLPPPRAAALVNPQLLEREDDPTRNLCSAGLSFKLAHALVKEGRRCGLDRAEQFDVRLLLDLAGLGTVADMVPLTGENRVLATAGLDWLAQTQRPGLMALKAVAQTPGRPGVYEVGFQLGPRLNAAGRLETASDALELVLCTETGRAEMLAGKLDRQNRERQRIERAIADEAIARVRTRFNPAVDYVIVEGAMEWHIGVVGIVASRVQKAFHRPTIILGGSGGEWRGSGRSIRGFDLAAALDRCDDLLLRHGGHAMAAGLALQPAQVGALQSRLNQLARQALEPHHLEPELHLDGLIPLKSLTVGLLAELERLEPMGQGNPQVQFALRNVWLRQPPRRMGRQEQHARLFITDGSSKAEAVWWNCAGMAMPEGAFDLAVAPRVDHYNGRTMVQLRVLDWRPTKQGNETPA